jgi:hypothetical protein
MHIHHRGDQGAGADRRAAALDRYRSGWLIRTGGQGA